MYGHTHRPFYEKEEGLITLNPGSLCYPRQPGRKPSYMIMQIDSNGKLEITQEYLNYNIIKSAETIDFSRKSALLKKI